jgi:hypothetical protein
VAQLRCGRMCTFVCVFCVHRCLGGDLPCWVQILKVRHEFPYTIGDVRLDKLPASPVGSARPPCERANRPEQSGTASSNMAGTTAVRTRPVQHPTRSHKCWARSEKLTAILGATDPGSCGAVFGAVQCAAVRCGVWCGVLVSVWCGGCGAVRCVVRCGMWSGVWCVVCGE